MSTPTSAFSRSTIVAQLRAAGCVYAEDEARLLLGTAGTATELSAMLDQRLAGVPLEHVLGWAEFGGLRIALDPGVFVPRRRTEFLLSQAVQLAARGVEDRPPVVVDLGCGSGALGAALAAALGPVELYAVDIDPAAVRCARRNLPDGAHVYLGDLDAPLPVSRYGRVDLLVANVPYVPSDAIELLPSEARLYEPRVALDGGADGLDILRRVAAVAPRWLTPGGYLLIETSSAQAADAQAAYARSGLVSWVANSEDLDATVVIGQTR